MAAFDNDGAPEDDAIEGAEAPFDRPEEQPLLDPWSEVTPAAPDAESPAADMSPTAAAPIRAELEAPKPRPPAIAEEDSALVVARKRPRRRPNPPTVEESVPEALPKPERRYPKMRALLRDSEDVPDGIAPLPEARPPPVPGTFFPAPRPPIMRREPADLDEMLATMAEGLLIGESPEGGTEVRVTLRDEFFAGTELRISAGDGTVRAVLVPPDRDTYFSLNGKIDELHERLRERGLNVRELRVEEP